MAKLYRNATTRDYYTKTRIKGEFVTLQIDNDGKNYLLQNGIVSQREIPPDMMSVLWQKGWLYTRGEYPHIFTAEAGAPVQQPLALGGMPVDNSQKIRNGGKQLKLPADVRIESHPLLKSNNTNRLSNPPSTNSVSADESVSSAKMADSPPQLPGNADDSRPGSNISVWIVVAVAIVTVVFVWFLFEVF